MDIVGVVLVVYKTYVYIGFYIQLKQHQIHWGVCIQASGYILKAVTIVKFIFLTEPRLLFERGL